MKPTTDQSMTNRPWDRKAETPMASQVPLASRSFITERLDHILFTEWDPIGVHLLDEFDCRDEYCSYLPTLVDLVVDSASIDEIAETLYEFEESIVGENLKCRCRCHLVALKILDAARPSGETARIPDLSRLCLKYQDQPFKGRCLNSSIGWQKLTIHEID